jgi:hypothetical protein
LVPQNKENDRQVIRKIALKFTLNFCNRSGGNQENELHGIGWNHYEQAVVIDFIANNSE